MLPRLRPLKYRVTDRFEAVPGDGHGFDEVGAWRGAVVRIRIQQTQKEKARFFNRAFLCFNTPCYTSNPCGRQCLHGLRSLPLPSVAGNADIAPIRVGNISRGFCGRVGGRAQAIHPRDDRGLGIDDRFRLGCIQHAGKHAVDREIRQRQR